MNRKTLQVLLGVVMTSTMLMSTSVCMPALAEEAAVVTETVEENEVATEADETEKETEVEVSKDAFQEGSAVLADYDYEKGELSENGWESNFLDMSYTPEKGVSMGLKENEQIEEYHLRNGKDKQVAHNEFVALDENDGYVQLMAEVNPNAEKAEDILGRFAKNEELELVSEAKETEVGGKTFLTCTGVKNKEKVMIGVCTDQDDIVIALKAKYKNTDARNTLLQGFEVVEKEEQETEVETDAKTETPTESETE